jgi:hypothetical protein
LRPSPTGRRRRSAEGGADAEQVHHHRLQRHQHRAEDGHQQQRREQDDDADEERQLVGDRVAEVLEDRGDAADVQRAPVCCSIGGITSSRMWSSRSVVAALCGEVVG